MSSRKAFSSSSGDEGAPPLIPLLFVVSLSVLSLSLWTSSPFCALTSPSREHEEEDVDESLPSVEESPMRSDSTTEFEQDLDTGQSRVELEMRGYSELVGREKVVEVAVIARVGDVTDSEEQDASSAELRATPTEEEGGGREEDRGDVEEESGLLDGAEQPLPPSPLLLLTPSV